MLYKLLHSGQHKDKFLFHDHLYIPKNISHNVDFIQTADIFNIHTHYIKILCIRVLCCSRLFRHRLCFPWCGWIGRLIWRVWDTQLHTSEGHISNFGEAWNLQSEQTLKNVQMQGCVRNLNVYWEPEKKFHSRCHCSECWDSYSVGH